MGPWKSESIFLVLDILIKKKDVIQNQNGTLQIE